MQSTVEKLDQRIKLTITVEQEDFREALKQSFKQNAKRFSVPGFRKGKAPMNIVTRYYGEAVLYDDAINIASEPAFEKALKEHDLQPYSRPEMDLVEINEDKGFIFSCEFAAKPEVELAKYKGVKSYLEPVTVKDEDVEELLSKKQEELSRIVPVEDRAVQDGDIVVLDYEGFVDGIAFDGGKAENHELTIGSNSFIPGFEEQVIGHSPEEDKFEIKVKFPEEYHSEDLAGKDAVFEINISEIKVKELPEIDDELIKDISEDYDTVEEWKAGSKKELLEERTKQADKKMRNKAVEQVILDSKVKYDPAMQAEQVDKLVDNQKSELSRYGMSLEMYLQYSNVSEEVFRSQLKGQADFDIKLRYVLLALAAAENFELSDEDYEKHFEDIAEMYKKPLDEIKKVFDNEEARLMSKDDLLIQKANQFIKDHVEASSEKPEEEVCEDEDCDCENH